MIFPFRLATIRIVPATSTQVARMEWVQASQSYRVLVDSLVKIAEAAIAAGFAPLEFRVFRGEQPEAEALELSLWEFRNIVAENSFSGRVA